MPRKTRSQLVGRSEKHLRKVCDERLDQLKRELDRRRRAGASQDAHWQDRAA